MTDLKELLRSAAAEAENVSVDGSALLPAIRRRRRIRSAAVGVGGVAAVTTLAVGAYAVLPGAEAPVAAPVGGVPTYRSADCKVAQAFHSETGSRTVKLTQKSMKRTGELTWSGTVEVTVTNTSKVTLYTKNTPTLFTIFPVHRYEDRGGSVQATAPKNIALKPGASHTSTVRVTVHGCSSWKQPAGSYSVSEPTTGPRPSVGTLQLP